MKKLYSIGHSNRTAEELIEKLKENAITDLVDVRTTPYSKYNPQFNKDPLRAVIEKAGIKYHWKGKNLGGLGRNIDFDGTIIKMLGLSSDTRRFCVMCSESYPLDCHRTETIEPVVQEQDSEMVHILWSEKDEAKFLKARPELKQKSLL